MKSLLLWDTMIQGFNKIAISSILIIGISAMYIVAVCAQPKTSSIVNFNLQDYGGGSQNWDIDSKGDFVYVANNAGLFEFDGRHWRLYQLPNKTIIRSVKICENRIYTGSYEEFGYWSKKDDGTLEYHSLSQSIPASSIESHFVWSINQLGNNIVFKTFNAIYLFDGEKTKEYKLNGTLIADAVIDNAYYVYVYDHGLQKLEDDGFTNLGKIESPENIKIKAILSHDNDKLLLISERAGMFEFEKGQFNKWPMPLDEEMKTNQFNDVLESGQTLYLGTVRNGVYIYDRNTSSWSNISTKNGLSDNTILSSVMDERGNIWFALDNGVSAIPENRDMILLNQTNQDIGVVHDLERKNGKIYAATNTGVYVFQNEEVNFVEGTLGLTWSITEVGDELIYGHNSGTFSINQEGQIHEISQDNGGYEFIEIPYEPNTYIQCNYSGLTKYISHGDGSWQSQRISGILVPIKQIVFESANVAWVAHAYKGLQRITLNDAYDSVIKIENHYLDEIPNIYDIRLYQCFNQITAFSSGKWFKYNPLKDQLEPFLQLTKLLDQDSSSYAISPFADQPILLRTMDEQLVLKSNLKEKALRLELLDQLYRNKLLRGEGMQKAKVYDSVVYVGLDNDVLFIDANAIWQQQSAQPLTNLRLFLNEEPMGKTDIITLVQKDIIKIEIGAPLLANERYEYRILPGQKEWNTFNGDLELETLPTRKSEIEIRGVNALGSKSQVSSIELYKRPSWIFGWKGLLLVLLLLAGVILITRVINNFILIRHKKYLEEKYIHEQELREKELTIQKERHETELLKRHHELEIQAKRKELANSAMAMVKKNELLQEMKSEIINLKDELSDKTSVNKIVSHIDRNLHKEKDWEVFESNFNKIHDSFFQNLLRMHDAKLSPKDLRLSAYLKMNLSSKEIAPLMGISVRGVEIHRYRLRKKLALSSDKNLSEYLNSLDGQ